MKILVTGGSGYKGSVLIPKLLKLKHRVISLDTQWFGNHLPKHKNLKNIKFDIRDIENFNFKNIDTVIHLASIANDNMSELDKNLSWETSSLATYQLLEKAVQAKVKRFIYASSGSVYGIKKEKNVVENLSLKPISLYNKVKMCTERIILSYKDKIETFIIRPATVCGYSPRMRFDVSVNALTMSGLTKDMITVHGGSQIRPNIHIDDITDLYIFLLKVNKKFSGIYNAGFENMSIKKISELIANNLNCKVKIKKNLSDPRSYRLDSSKLLKIGFKPKKNISNAIEEIIEMYQKGILKDKSMHHSILWLKKILKN
tara:strand:+ start:1 stop:945 length:945 start_codon:yes stop_codon:yes gene_type:complete